MTRVSGKSRNPSDRWPAWLALGAAAVLSFAACCRKIWEIDFWWQLATGRYVSEHGWPTVDVFSYTAAGQPWIELRWLFCFAQFQLMDWVGPSGLILLKWVAVVTAFGLVSIAATRGRPGVAAGLTLALAVLASSQRLFVRPELVTYVMFAAFVWILHRHRRLAGRLIWALPVLQIVWVNSHTLFILGPVVVGAFALAEAWSTRAVKKVTWALVAAVSLACLVSPYGLNGALFPLQLYREITGTVFKETITEFQGPFAFGTSSTAVRCYLVLIALSVGAALANLRRLDPFGVLLLASQLYLSLLAIRNLPLFCLAAVPFILSHLEVSGIESKAALARWFPVGRRLTACLVAAGCGFFALDMATGRHSLRENDSNQPGLGIAEHRYAFAAADFLDRQRLGGRAFATLLESSYLIYRGRPMFMDPRLEVHGEQAFQRFLAAQNDARSWREAVSEHDLRVAVAGLSSRLAALLEGEPGWTLAHFDDVAAVFVREPHGDIASLENPQDFRRALDDVRRRLPRPKPYAELGPFERVTPPEPYLAVADFILMHGDAEAARPFLEDAAAASPWVRGLALRRATLAELAGDWRGVIEQSTLALEDAPEDPRAALKLGAAYYRTGDLGRAKLWLERALEELPDRAASWAMLGSIHVLEGDFDRASSRFARAVALASGEPSYRVSLAQVQAKLGRMEEAIATLEAALALDSQNVRILRDLALFEVATGDLEAARRYLDRALAIAPDDPQLQALQRRLQR